MSLKEPRQSRAATYQDLLAIPSEECRENFVVLEPKSGCLTSKYILLTDMSKLFGKQIVLRKSVSAMLQIAASRLSSMQKDWLLLVTYGYRSPYLQKEYFKSMFNKLKSTYLSVNSKEFYEQVHKNIAVPAVAGHPTGGAVDVCLQDQKGCLIDCGSRLYDFEDEKKEVSRPIGSQQRKARYILRTVMLEIGFAPFNGEWWHFSYGDKEWAWYYEKPYAIYTSTPLKIVRDQIRLM